MAKCSRSHPSSARPPREFDDHATSVSIGTLTAAFCVGGALTLLALGAARAAHA
ncbi:MAG: hypothetical protein JWQ03_2477, partial [Variovorax sp.]|nr:hypothetical protein [Variovorax sp.]